MAQTLPYFDSIRELVAYNTMTGRNWFDVDTMAYWDTRVEGQVIRGRWFVTSDNPTPGEVNAHRVFTARRIEPNGSIREVGEFGEHTTVESAKRACEADYASMQPKVEEPVAALKRTKRVSKK